MPSIRFTLNGKETDASYEPGMHLLEVLREECGIVSAKNGCAPEGACGCCLVMIDGTPALSCLRKPEQMEGHEVVTLEGLPEETRRRDGRGVRARGRRPVRLLHSRASSSAPRRSIEQGKTDDRDADRQGARRPSVPLHRLRANHRRHSDGGEAAANGGSSRAPSRGATRSSAKSSG